MGVFILRAARYVRQAHNLKVLAINLSPHVHLLMNLLRQKVSFLIKLFFKKALWTIQKAMDWLSF